MTQHMQCIEAGFWKQSSPSLETAVHWTVAADDPAVLSLTVFGLYRQTSACTKITCIRNMTAKLFDSVRCGTDQASLASSTGAMHVISTGAMHVISDIFIVKPCWYQAASRAPSDMYNGIIAVWLSSSCTSSAAFCDHWFLLETFVHEAPTERQDTCGK